MGHQYADEVRRILNNEFYRKGVSPAQLFELDTPSFSEIIGRGIGGGCAFGFGAMILPQVMK